MTPAQYERLVAPIRPRPWARALVKAANRYLPLAYLGGYALLLGWLLLTRDARILRVFLTTFAAFGGCTVLRHIRNAPRPYECGIDALFPRKKAGQSFPSRHVLSAAVISAAFWYVYPPLGVISAALTVVLACARVLAGVHFPRDVIAGGLFGGAVGILGCFVL